MNDHTQTRTNNGNTALHPLPDPGCQTTPGLSDRRNLGENAEIAGKTRLPAADVDGMQLYTADELALSLGQSKRWIYRQVEERGMPAIKLGRALVFQLPAVAGWLERQRVGDWSPGLVGDER